MTLRSHTIALLAGAMLLAIAASARAQSSVADLTGTWEGKLKCKIDHADNGDAGSFKVDSTLRISTVGVGGNGSNLSVLIGGIDYSGRTIDTGRGKGEAVFVGCGSGESAWFDRTEIFRSKFKVNAEKGTGSLKGTSVLNEAYGTPGLGTLLRCKAKWKRVSTDEPAGVNGCDE